MERRGQATCVEIDQGQLATGGTRWSRRKAAAFKGRTSRISREAYVRSCERLGVQFPGPTRRSAGDRRPYADQAHISGTIARKRGKSHIDGLGKITGQCSE